MKRVSLEVIDIVGQNRTRSELEIHEICTHSSRTKFIRNTEGRGLAPRFFERSYLFTFRIVPLASVVSDMAQKLFPLCTNHPTDVPPVRPRIVIRPFVSML